MRGKLRGQQNISVVSTTKVDKLDDNGDKTGEKVESYVLKNTYNVDVSTSASLPNELSGGEVLDYDRVITSFHKLDVNEGDKVFIDRILIYSGGQIVNFPDYVVKRKIETEKGKVYRYGIKKLV